MLPRNEYMGLWDFRDKYAVIREIDYVMPMHVLRAISMHRTCHENPMRIHGLSCSQSLLRAKHKLLKTAGLMLSLSFSRGRGNWVHFTAARLLKKVHIFRYKKKYSSSHVNFVELWSVIKPRFEIPDIFNKNFRHIHEAGRGMRQ